MSYEYVLDDFKTSSDFLKNAFGDLIVYSSSIQRTVNDLSSSWIGKGYNSFSSNYESILRQINAVADKLEILQDNLLKVSELYEMHEEKFQNIG